MGEARPPTWEMISTTSAISKLIDDLTSLQTTPLTLYADLEGINLSSHGSVSLLQFHETTSDRTIFIDVIILGTQAFTTAGKTGQTLKTMLESADVVKYFFDVRNDSDALFSHFGIWLAGIRDIQLMEFATRPSNIEEEVPLRPGEVHRGGFRYDMG